MNQYIDRIRDIVLSHMNKEQVNVYLFGSWARGTAQRSSDVNVAAVFDMSTTSTLYGMVDFSKISRNPAICTETSPSKGSADTVCEEIRREGIVWKKA